MSCSLPDLLAPACMRLRSLCACGKHASRGALAAGRLRGAATRCYCGGWGRGGTATAGAGAAVAVRTTHKPVELCACLLWGGGRLLGGRQAAGRWRLAGVHAAAPPPQQALHTGWGLDSRCCSCSCSVPTGAAHAC